MTAQIKLKRQTVVLTSIAAIAIVLAVAPAAGAQEKKSIGEKYGSREPLPCEDIKAWAAWLASAVVLAVKEFYLRRQTR